MKSLFRCDGELFEVNVTKSIKLSFNFLLCNELITDELSFLTSGQIDEKSCTSDSD